jgi:tyrosyl-tRNA synthetase
MSISDDLMWRWYDLLSMRSAAELARLRGEVAQGRNPRDAKVLLAQELVTRFHSARAADDALAEFDARFRGGAAPQDLAEVKLAAEPQGGLGLAALLKQAGLVPSTSEAVRNIEQRGVRIDGHTVQDRTLRLEAGTYVVQVGKRRWARVIVGHTA